MHPHFCHAPTLSYPLFPIEMSKPVRILIAGGTAVSRRALITLLNTKPSFEVVGEAADDSQLTTVFTETYPDLVLFDGLISGEAREDVIQGIRGFAPQTAVLVLCAQPDQKEIALAAGADAFVLKGDPPKRLLTTLEAIRIRRGDV